MSPGTKATRARKIIEMPPLDRRILEYSFLCAGANWLTWLADYTFEGNAELLPVLQDRSRFITFCSEYRPLRGVAQNTQEEIRLDLIGSADFQTAIAQDSGHGIDVLADRLRDDFDLAGVPRSFVSKLAAFALPDRFVAWDRFARGGTSRLLYGRKTSTHKKYQCYLGDFDLLWNHPATGGTIMKYVSQNSNGGAAFGRRVLDVYLMTVGGRWGTELSLP